MAYHKKETLRGNIEAIRTLLAVEKEHRLPTPVEREVLSRYNGFGGLACILKPADTLPDAQPRAAAHYPRSFPIFVYVNKNIIFVKNVLYSTKE
ncbi:hypothetical protein [Porphyromonas gingivalis]|uniref:hypothetical protein n=1 Tax=Porphyromonas gingivalis TaxID=837 RepID=UPI000A479D7B|nr:hypothetical protein [Porphyromonas gingivalis]